MTDQFCPQCGERLEENARFCAACGKALSRRTTKSTSRRQPTVQRLLSWPLLIVVVGSILILAGVLLNGTDPKPVVDVSDEHDASGLPYPDVPRVAAAETRKRFDNDTAVIVDVRSQQEYADAHISNALSLPLDELQSRYQELPRDAAIITYCT